MPVRGEPLKALAQGGAALGRDESWIADLFCEGSETGHFIPPPGGGDPTGRGWDVVDHQPDPSNFFAVSRAMFRRVGRPAAGVCAEEEKMTVVHLPAGDNRR
ncbi:hypothetical protein JCM4914_59410 [Streptomyces platensis subsp. malvinus]